jgi:hypothetical protein
MLTRVARQPVAAEIAVATIWGMPTISRLLFGAEDAVAAAHFWNAAMPENAPVEVSESNAPTDGFRGFTLSLIAAQPGDVDALVSAGRDAGADLVKAAAKSLCGATVACSAPPTG